MCRSVSLFGLKVMRDGLTKEAADLQRLVASGELQITPEKVERLTRLLRDMLVAPRGA